MISDKSTMTVTEELRDLWDAFFKKRQSCGSCFAHRDGAFSIILDSLGEKAPEVCKTYGFTESQFNQLHQLLVTAEQQCLLTLFIAFEKFKSLSLKPNVKEISASISTSSEESAPIELEQKLSSSTNSNALVEKDAYSNAKADSHNEDSDNSARKHRSRKKMIANDKTGPEQSTASLTKVASPSTDSERLKVQQENVVTEDSEMGRGKRKKFVKMQFDMLEETQSGKPVSLTGSLQDRNKNRQSSRKETTTGRKKLEGPESKKQRLSSIGDVVGLKIEKSGESSAFHGRIGYDVGNDNRSETLLKAIDKHCDNPECETGGLEKEKSSDTSCANHNLFDAKMDCEENIEGDSKLVCKDGGSDKTIVKREKPQVTGERTDFECDNLAPIICSICKERLPKSRDLFKHWKVAHKEQDSDGAPLNLFFCNVCKESFDSPRRFKLHYRIHSGARPHPCQLCAKKFRIYKGLMDHMMCHTKERPYACPQCPKCFINKKLLNHHIKVHNNEVVPRVCELCGKQYRTALGLKLHYRVHAGIRPHKCDVCGMAFTQRCSLQIHKRLHTGDKRHICDVCGWRFNTNNALVTHKRVHTGERPYKCSQCSFQAASSSCLKDHQIVHSSAKPFQCRAPGCNKHFKRQAHLMTHLKKKHSGLKPYSCDLCGSRFAMVSELTHHQKSDACDSGRIKREQSPELDPKPDFMQFPAEPLSSIVSTNQQNQTVVLLDSQEGLNEDDGPRMFGKKKPKLTQTPAQEFQISHVEEMPEVEENQIVIHIVTDPGTEGTDVVLSEEEMAAIVRLSQQM